MVGAPLTLDFFPRDRLVSICQSASKADAFERLVKQMRPNVNSDLLIVRLESLGIEDASRIVNEIHRQCNEHLQALEKWVSYISDGVA